MINIRDIGMERDYLSRMRPEEGYYGQSYAPIIPEAPMPFDPRMLPPPTPTPITSPVISPSPVTPPTPLTQFPPTTTLPPPPVQPPTPPPPDVKIPETGWPSVTPPPVIDPTTGGWRGGYIPSPPPPGVQPPPDVGIPEKGWPSITPPPITPPVKPPQDSFPVPEGWKKVYRTAEAWPETAGDPGVWNPSEQMPHGYSLTPPGTQPVQPPPTTITPGTTPWEPIPPTPPGGEGFPYPTQWGAASEALTELAQTGMPGITPEYAEKAWLPYQRRGQQEAMQAREQAGLGGLRWSTPLAGRLEDIWGGAAERFGGEMERMRLQDITGQRGARLGATGQLMGLGGQYAGLPLDVASRMMGMGATQQQMQQQEYNRQLQEFIRTQPEYAPLLQSMMGGATGIGMAPGVYQPSFGSGMLGLGGQLGMGALLGAF